MYDMLHLFDAKTLRKNIIIHRNASELIPLVLVEIFNKFKYENISFRHMYILSMCIDFISHTFGISCCS